MKNIFKYLLSFSLTLILLVSTLQFSIYKMECLMTGSTQISLSDFDDCNKRSSDISISKKCCEFGSLTFDFDYQTDVNSKEFKLIVAAFGSPLQNTTTSKKVIPKNDFNCYTNLPPPSGYELIKVVQVFRI